MPQQRRRKCLNCGVLFTPDVRNRRHQRHCSASACRKASKRASQQRWLGKKVNQNYFKGPAHVQRTQAWREAHPDYIRHSKLLSESALQDDSLAQVVENKGESGELRNLALQDLLGAQPFVLIGLISHLTGYTLQDDIAQTGHRLRQLGDDILSGGAHAKTSIGPSSSTSDPPTIQLGGSSPGS